MGSLRILDLEEARTTSISFPDVYYTPEYGQCVQESEDGEWQLAIWEPGPILYPFLRRSIPHPGSEPLQDIVSPYGYSGPWSEASVSQEEWSTFRKAFRQQCHDWRVVSEFVRFHPLLPGRLLLTRSDEEFTVEKAASTVSLDLSDGYETAWSRYEGRTRTAIRKARKLGYVTRIRLAADVDRASRRQFQFLYESTMRRVEAKSYYYFPESYFDSLWSNLAGSMLLGEVLSADEETIAAALFLKHGEFLHYHLAGSDRMHARNGVNNLMLDSLVEWGCLHGFRRFHLGGGLSEGDPLFRFKAAFGPERNEFWLGRCVLAPPVYDRLMHDVAKERAVPPATLLASGFFPAYRTPIK